MRRTNALPRPARQALPDFTPVPRRPRADGWTPERQKAFIEALADTGCVSRAAAMVNMAQANCYTLRRAPGAEEFRAAWDAALDLGVARLKDIAFERAIEGELVPVVAEGKVIGYRRKRNDALLMFCLRHYGQDGEGRRTTINYFSTRAEAAAGASAGDGGAQAGAVAQASTVTVRTVIAGAGGEAVSEPQAAALVERFAGVELDAEALAAVETAMLACAERRRTADGMVDQGGTAALEAMLGDPDQGFVRASSFPPADGGPVEPLAWMIEVPPGERHWSHAGTAPLEVVAPDATGTGEAAAGLPAPDGTDEG